MVKRNLAYFWLWIEGCLFVMVKVLEIRKTDWEV
jgi:hypothetical protein